MKIIFSFLILLFCQLTWPAQAQWNVQEDNNTVQLQNNFATFSFKKSTADLTAIRYKGQNLLGNKGSAYLSGPDFGLFPSHYQLHTQNDSIIDISFSHTDKNHFSYSLHYVLKKNIPGIFVYLIERHTAKDSIGIYEQTRWGLRADPALFDFHLVRDSIQGPMYAMDSLESGEKLQDWTYQMKSGKIYTKYDYADYIDGRNVHGMYGRRSGLGLFVIQASHDYLNGGPTKQYMTVHSNPYLICMLNCSHFLSTNRIADDTIQNNWEKLSGPFLLYLNDKPTIAASWDDAKKEARKQIVAWPFQWLQNDLYPLQRGQINIQAVDEKSKGVANATFVLADSAHDWQAQSAGYIYWGHSDINGNVHISNIRPGKYTLYSFGANQLADFRKDDIHISIGKPLSLKALLPDESAKTIWQLGIADRKTTGFHYGNHQRVYGLFDSVPANLDDTIGLSHDTNWYYAQTKIGSWNIHFQTNKIHADSLVLYVALAGAAKEPQASILLNGKIIGKLKDLGNDRSIYRSAIAGGYYQLKVFHFSSIFLKKENILTIRLEKCPRGGGLMYDAIRLAEK